MKKVFCILTIALMINQLAYAEQKKLATDVAPKKATALSVEEEAKRADRRKKLEEKKAEINGSEWQVQLKSQGDVKGTMGSEDTLKFQDGRFSSKNSEKEGYTATNYTLTVQDTGPTIWETMQTKSDGEITFWRGEWTEKSMSGVLNRQLTKEKGNVEYMFSSVATKRIPPTSAADEGEFVEKTPEPPKVLSSVPVAVQTEPKKKKNGFWSS